MKKQTQNYNDYAKGMFIVFADTVAELRDIEEQTDGMIDVVTIRDGGNIERFGSLICQPEEWQAVCQAEIDNNPNASDWDSAEETVCNEDCRKHRLAVLLSGDEWSIEEGQAVRYQCEECECWHDSEEDAADCCK